MSVHDEFKDEPQELQIWSITTGLKGLFQVGVLVRHISTIYESSNCPERVYTLELHGNSKVYCIENAN